MTKISAEIKMKIVILMGRSVNKREPLNWELPETVLKTYRTLLLLISSVKMAGRPKTLDKRRTNGCERFGIQTQNNSHTIED